MQIRKNTKAFKTILEIISVCRDRPDREKLIRLYITKAGDSIADRISVEGIQGEAGLFYEMTYQRVLNNLKSSNHQLQVSDKVPGIYFFHSSSNKAWDETPFEFDEAIKKEFASLPELPEVRKKGKAEKFVLPTSPVQTKSPAIKKQKAKKSTKPAKAEKGPERGPKQPDYKLKHKIMFTNLDSVVYRQPGLSKLDVLNYYNKISEYLLPYLKDRPVWVRVQSETMREPIVVNALFQKKDDDLPNWIRHNKKQKEQTLLCNDREHLLFFVDRDCLEFDPCHAKIKSIESPDYLVIAIDSPASEPSKAVGVALRAKEILDGLQLPSFVKTDGVSGLHLYVPLDGKSTFEASSSVAEYLCKLIRLKIPDLVSITGVNEYVYGKVSLDYALNAEGKSAVAPYSLLPGQAATVAAPLSWEEVTDGLRIEDFNYATIFDRLKAVGDVFKSFYKKKVNAEEVLERLEEGYSFLV